MNTLYEEQGRGRHKPTRGSVRTTINWRPYPEQRPDDTDFHPVRYAPSDGKDAALALLAFRDGCWYDEDEDFDHSEYVTHFALPEDIVTEEQ